MYSKYITRIREPSLGIICFICLMIINDWYAGKNIFYQIIGFIIVCIIGYIGLSHNQNVKTVVSPRVLIYSVLTGYGFLVIATGLPILLGADTMVKLSTKYSLSSLFYLAIMAPILEEVIFRQILYRDWAYHFNKYIGQILIGFLFIILHWPSDYFSWIFYIFSTIGLYVAYTLSGDNLKISICVHMTNNIIIALFVMNQLILVNV